LTSKEIRQSFIDFFVQRGHTFVPSSSVVPQDDPTLLFANAGMNQFKNLFLGSAKRSYVRAANSQKCIRVSGKHNDLEEVGKDTYHHTFFEMLGNWSFGDYFKAEAIEWAWELVTKVWGIDKNKIWATVFGGDPKDGVPADEEAERLWIEKTELPKERVLRFGRKDNFWELGDTGPCGPCSEVHMDLGPGRCDKQHMSGHVCGVNQGCARFIELWNLVFIQFNRDERGTLTELPAKHVDTGAGLERVVSVLQNKTSNYDTDLFSPIIEHINRMSGKKYTGKLGNDIDNAFRVIADHVRTLSFAIADGALPSNDGRGYVLRRILRRGCRFGLLLDKHEPFIYELVPTVVEIMGEMYPELKSRMKHVMNVIQAEEASFGKTLDRGIEIFESDVAELRKAGGHLISGEKVFRLYDTYGFPLDLTQLMAQEKGVEIDGTGFEMLMEQQRARARASQQNATYVADALADQMPQTDDTQKYHTRHLAAKLLGFVLEDRYITEGPVPAGQQVGLILDRTCAYAESGGQEGDAGTIEGGEGSVSFEDAQWIGSAVAHFGKLTRSGLHAGQAVEVHIDPKRMDIRRNHTATHLLQWALREVLGDHAHQQGSLVGTDYLRFDFTHPKALTKEEIHQVEHLVRKSIEAAHPVTFKVLPIDQAKKLGAMALFSEKYGENVRVLAIGTDNPDQLEEAFSREFCGGTHVNNTEEIGGFKIVREESVATGVRRITALTGRGLNEMLYAGAEKMEQLCVLLKSTPDQVVERVEAILEDNKKLKKQLVKGSSSDLKSAAQDLLGTAESVGDAKVILGKIPFAPEEAIRSQIDSLRKKASSHAIVLLCETEDRKVQIFAAVSDDLIAKGLKAGDLAKQTAAIVGGGGGGRPQFAQAGGKDPAKMEEALAAAKTFIHEKLS